MTKVKDLIAALQEFGGEEEVFINPEYPYYGEPSADTDITLYRVKREEFSNLPNGGVLLS